jgi:hypothetical protein
MTPIVVSHPIWVVTTQGPRGQAVSGMKLIAIQTDNPQQGRFVFTAIEEATVSERVQLTDMVLASDEGHGLAVHHLRGWFSRMFGESIDDGRARRIAAQAAPGSAFVFALGAEDQVEAVARRVRTLTDGAIRTFDVEGDALHETTGRDATYELQDTESARLSEPEIDWTEVSMTKQRLEQD